MCRKKSFMEECRCDLVQFADYYFRNASDEVTSYETFLIRKIKEYERKKLLVKKSILNKRKENG